MRTYIKYLSIFSKWLDTSSKYEKHEVWIQMATKVTKTFQIYL